MITSLPTSPNLNNLAQRDMFTFVAFLLQDQALPREVLTPLIDSHILPALSALLALPHRADRHRIVLGEALSAVLQLLTTHPKEMIRGGKWKCWFKGSILGLWDGHKKGISVKGRSLKLAGRLIKCLTSPIEWTLEGMEWVKERESISRQVGETMLVCFVHFVRIIEASLETNSILPSGSLERDSGRSAARQKDWINSFTAPLSTMDSDVEE